MRPFFAIAFVLCSAGGALGNNWPQFRGPGGNAVADDAELPLSWSKTESVTWVVDVPGRSWSSPIVWGSRVFVTSAIESTDATPSFAGFFVDDIAPEDMRQPDDFVEPVSYMIYVIDVETGRTLWEREAHRGRPPFPFHVKNGLATETPATDGERVYAYFGGVGLFAYDMDGELVWQHDVAARKLYYDVGPASCPIVADGRVYLLQDNEEASALVALDAETGDLLWRSPRKKAHEETGSGWMTPFFWRNSVRSEIVTTAPGHITSYSPGGDALWSLSVAARDIVASPVGSGDVVFVPVGSPWENDRPMFAIRAGARGAIDPNGEVVLWQERLGAPYLPSPLVYRDKLFVMSGRGILTVYDAEDGERLYRARLGDGAGFTSSPWAADGRVFFLSEDGDTYVVASGNDREMELLAANSLDEHTQASPAVAHDSLFIRTASRLYRIAK